MSQGWICKLNLTPKQTFMLWEALNQTWFTNAKKEQHELLRILRDQLMKHGGNENPELRFVQDDDPDTSRAKIALARAVAVVISAGLGILGVTPVEEMR